VEKFPKREKGDGIRPVQTGKGTRVRGSDGPVLKGRGFQPRRNSRKINSASAAGVCC